MKSLPIYLNEEKKSQGILWVCEKPNVTLRIHICNFLTWERGWSRTMLLFSCLKLWFKNESKFFFFITLVLWVVRVWSVHYWFNSCCLMSFVDYSHILKQYWSYQVCHTLWLTSFPCYAWCDYWTDNGFLVLQALLILL